MIDGIVPEPPGGAQNDWKEAARLLREALGEALEDLDGRLRRGARPPPAGEVPGDGRFRLAIPLFLGIFHTLHRLFPGCGPRLVHRFQQPVVNQVEHDLQRGFPRRRLASMARSDLVARTARKRDPKRDARAVRGRRSAGSSRSSSSSATTRGGSTTTSGSSGTARSRAGRCRRACRSSPGSARLAVHVEDHPLALRDLRGRDPEGRVRRRDGRDLGQRHVRARRGEARRRAHRPPARQAARGAVDAGPGEARRRPEELAAPQEARRAAPATDAGPVRADARHARRQDVPRGEGWLFEVKWDGYRALAYVRRRRGASSARGTATTLTERFPRVAEALPRALKTPDCVLDGEVCALDEQGRPSFSAMQQGEARDADRLRRLRPARGRGRAARRPAAAASAASGSRSCSTGGTAPSGSPRRSTTARRSLAAAKAQRLEGIIAKRADSPYRPGKRTREWLKIKTARQRQEFVIAGYTKGQGRRAGRFGALVLGIWQGDELVYAGNVGTGFTDADDRRAAREAAPARAAGAAVPRGRRRCRRCARRDVVWVEPELVAEVEFVEWTHDGRLRAPSFQGLREDKSAARGAQGGAAARPRSARASACSSSRTSTRSSSRTTGSRRATCSPTTARSRRCSCRTCKDRPFTMKRYPDGIARRLLLPEGRAEAHARVDPDAAVRGLDARAPRRDASDRRRRSSTTSSRCSGW